MKFGMIGLGRMGANMVTRLLAGGHECVVFDRDPEKGRALLKVGVQVASSLEELTQALPEPRIVWTMLPAGAPTEETIARFENLLSPGDVLVDGGNSYFKDGVRRGIALSRKGIRFLDVGVSGGVWGLERGYCLMIGGEKDAVGLLDPLFSTLAPSKDRGRVYCGPSGSGHFAKMVHNGIEYGMMQSLAEGFHILQGANQETVAPEYRYDLNLGEIAEAWRSGSVVSSWLLDLSALALQADPKLSAYEGKVEDSGEGRWTIQAAIEESVPAEVLATSLFVRFRSRLNESFAEKLLSAMRHGFGGHRELKKGA